MDESTSVTEWLNGLKAGRADAAQKLWERYVEQVVRVANRRLGGHPRRAADEQDIAQEAFASFFRSVEAGRFPQLDDRNDLWQVLILLTDRTANKLLRRELADKRGAGKVQGESAFAGKHSGSAASSFGIAQQAAAEPSPESVTALIRALESSLEKLPDEVMRQIALDKLQGYTDKEIAVRRGIALRSVERKLSIIRRILEREVGM